MAKHVAPAQAGDHIQTEAQAIARLKAGDLAGLEALVQHYQVKAVHVAILIVHDRALAEEIAQNSFFHAAQKIDQFDSSRPFGPWFLKSVANAAVQEANRQKRAVPLEDDDPAETAQAAAWLADPNGCPEQLAESAELRRSLWKALDQLPPNQRAAIVLRYLQGGSEAELTRVLQRPPSTIKWWLHAARERLRHILQREYYPAAEDQEAPHD
jgi:RNA polymerase sigma-70 factor, ECF subfamily